MPSTYSALYYHLVFATKNRRTFIKPEWRDRLHKYLGGAVRGLDGFPDEIGGVADHVHLLIGLKPTHCIADVVREIKKSSSVWVHEELNFAEFAWQEGYSVFSVSPNARDGVRSYVLNQEKHHLKKPFRDELVELLELAGVGYDPRFLD